MSVAGAYFRKVAPYCWLRVGNYPYTILVNNALVTQYGWYVESVTCFRDVHPTSRSALPVTAVAIFGPFKGRQEAIIVADADDSFQLGVVA